TRFSRDWSSDVCSSDLMRLARAADGVNDVVASSGQRARDLVALRLAAARGMVDMTIDDQDSHVRVQSRPPGPEGADAIGATRREIGRAAWRERRVAVGG